MLNSLSVVVPVCNGELTVRQLISRLEPVLAEQVHCFSEKNNPGPSILLFLQNFLVDSEHFADEKSWYEGVEIFNRATKEIAEKFSIPFVDQASFFREKREFFTDGFHMIPEGRKLKAHLFFEKIVQLGLLEETQR